MKILYVITKGNWGGAQRYVYDLATHFAKEHTVSVFGGPGILHDKLTAAGIRSESAPFLQRNVNPLFDLKTFFALIKLFRRERPDIIHVNSSKIGGIGGLAARIALPKSRIVFTAHGWAFNEDRSTLSKIIIAALHWITVALSHKTIAVSAQIKRELPGKFGSNFSNKIEVIHPGIEAKKFLTIEEARRTLIGKAELQIEPEIEKHPLWIGTISELHKNKGLTYLIHALKKIHHPFHMFIIGEGEERENLTKQIVANNMQDKVFLVGAIADAYQYLKAFDIFTLTSITESFGYVILEAGLAQRAVIASNVGGIPEIITQSQNGILVKPRDIKEISQSLSYIIENKQKRSEIAKHLKETVGENFSIEVMYQKTNNLYRSLHS